MRRRNGLLIHVTCQKCWTARSGLCFLLNHYTHTHVAPTYLQVSYSVVAKDICGQRSDKFPSPDDFHAHLRSDGWTLACGALGLQGVTHRGSCIGYSFKVASFAANGEMKCWKSLFVFHSTPKLRGIRQKA